MSLPNILQELLQAPQADRIDAARLQQWQEQYPYFETARVAQALHAAATGHPNTGDLYGNAALLTGNELWLQLLLDEATAPEKEKEADPAPANPRPAPPEPTPEVPEEKDAPEPGITEMPVPVLHLLQAPLQGPVFQ